MNGLGENDRRLAILESDLGLMIDMLPAGMGVGVSGLGENDFRGTRSQGRCEGVNETIGSLVANNDASIVKMLLHLGQLVAGTQVMRVELKE